ncbi:hypothetical protein [Virgibacillus sp. L01]|uniref:hypothetical protein n=1 Tax=Virgibacillus sp. L01 TaxID=3457429 RepID=UPI003FD26D14
MYLETVKIKNFRGYGCNQNREDGFFVFDDLHNDLVIFNGFNGFGKSSFFEAIEWGLTDSVSRLKNFEDIYNKNDLKKSYHLKFFHPSKRDSDEREICVILQFTNGLKLTRKSKSISIGFGNSDNYESTFYAEKDGYSVEDSFMDSLVKDGKIDSDKFIKSHLLGQESINHFIRSNRPEERRAIFMDMLNLNPLYTLYSEIKEYKRSGAITSEINKLESEETSSQNNIEQVDTFLEGRDFGSVSDYLNRIDQKREELKELVNRYSDSSEEKIQDSKVTSQKINSQGLADFNKFIDKESLRLNKLHTSQTDKLNAYKRIKETISRINELKIIEANYRKTAAYKFLLENSYTGIYSEITENVGDYWSSKKIIANQASKEKELIKLKTKLETAIQFNEDENISSHFINNLEQIIRDISLLKDFLVENTELSNEVKNVNRVVSFLEDTDWSNLEKQRKNLNEQLNESYRDIELIDHKIKSASTLNDTYQSLLLEMRNYIDSKGEALDECPVCLSQYLDDAPLSFTEDEPFYHKLLKIIDFTTQQGNEQVKELVETKKSMKVVEGITLDNLDKINEQFNEKALQIKQLITSVLDKSITYFSNLKVEGKELKKSAVDSFKKNRQKLRDLKKTIVELLGEQVKVDNVDRSNIREKIKELNEERSEWLEKKKSNFNFIEDPSISDILFETKELLNKDGVGEFYPEKTELLNKKITRSSKDLKVIEVLIEKIDEILKIKMPDDYLKMVIEYGKLEDKTNSIRDKISLLRQQQTQMNSDLQSLSALQEEAIESRLKNHPLIQWVYKAINPHPFYKNLIISSEKSGTNFKDEEENIVLDQIFSSAQLNVLALSVFLGLGLNNSTSKLNHFFLDDPIQSMDDINVLAFIDVLRGVLDSKMNKKMIVSTHDDNFAKLLSIKMRNKNTTHFKFENYTSEGPLYGKV